MSAVKLGAFAIIALLAVEASADGDDLDDALDAVQLLQTEVAVNSNLPFADIANFFEAAERADSELIPHADVALLESASSHVKPRDAALADDSEKKVTPSMVVAAAEPTTTTLEPTGMTLNAAGDLDAFLAALIANSIMWIGCVIFFSVMRLRYPKMYSNNVLEGFAPSTPPETLFGWYSASTKTTIKQVADSVGLDQAMLIEFCNLGMKIMAIIGIPMICVMGPMHWAFGGLAAGDDYLSYLSFGNVQNGSWLYWIHAFVVWAVVIVVQSSIYAAQKAFLQLRFDWLSGLPEVRANTVLVEGIPEEYQSDAKLKDFFSAMLPGVKVTAANVVKDTAELRQLVTQRAVATKELEKNQAQWRHAGQAPANRPMIRAGAFGGQTDAIEHYNSVLKELDPQIVKERERIKKEMSQVGGVNCCRGFVTFQERIHAAVAVQLEMTPDRDEWLLSVPPEPANLLWDDLMQDPRAEVGRQVLGYLLIAGLFFAYMPLVLGITNIANMINMGPLQAVWQGLAPTMGLQVMVAFLPTLLAIIFGKCFTLKASVYSQHKIQVWYFAFQVVFVILATAIGQDVNSFVKTLATDPFATFGVLASTMPYATHFYMNFLVLQWVTHAMNIMRLSNLGKYHAFSKIFDEDEAKKMAEPEDQDYYGLGSRSARFTINLCIGVVFGTLSPPINLLTFINFAICRLIYGYLIPFAETKKADIGGVFWVTKLKHLFIGNIIYCILMIGVLTERAATWGPMAIATPSLFYVIWSMRRFDNAFSWEKLPHVQLSASNIKRRPMAGTYVQPELQDN